MSLPQLLKIPSVQAFLMSGDIFDVLEDISKKHGLPVERSEEFLDLCDAVINGDLPLDHMPALISEAFGVPEDVAKKVSADVAGHRLLPLANFLPGLEEGIVALGGNLADYPELRIEKDFSAKRLVLDEVASSLQLSFSDVLLKRLAFLLQQYARGEKTEESLKTFFTRSLNIGGLGLSEEQATALLAATLPYAKTLIEEPAPAPKPVEKPKSEPVSATPQSVVPAAPKQELEVAPSHAVAAEVPVVSQPIPPLPPKLQKVETPPPVPKVSKPATPPRPKSAEPDIDPNELKIPAKKAAVARKLTASVQDSFAAALVLATENAAAVLKKRKISEKVFADLAGKAIRGVRDIYQTRDIVERDWELQGEDLATLMQAITAGVDAYHNSSPMDAAQPDAAKSQNASPRDDRAELDQRFSKLTKTSEADKIEPVKAQLTVGSANLKTPDGQRKVVDVVSNQRLAGPVEQLGKMTPAEFRRLSSSASEAAQKVEDLLSALESTSYEERVKGVLAWRDSPMNQLYLQIAKEALAQGLALPEVSSRRRAAGKESLSPAEIKALALLNAKIRF